MVKVYNNNGNGSFCYLKTKFLSLSVYVFVPWTTHLKVFLNQ